MASVAAGVTAKRPPLWTIGGASFIGTAFEFYGTQTYAIAAALVIPELFFPTVSPFLGAVAAFGALAATSITGPLGGIVFGHIGDRAGRKNALIATLLLMGLATFTIGCLPTYARIGVLAPVLLISMNLLQGLAFGGEYGGAVLLAWEHAPISKRCFYASLSQTGLPAGTVLGNAIWLAIGGMPKAQLLAWGWRVPFLVSIVIAGVGVLIRLRMTDPPEFQALKERGAEARVPLWEAIRDHWQQMVLVGGSFLGFGLFANISITYMILYATKNVGVARQTILGAILIATALQLVALPLGGWLSDRFGARRMVLIGAFTTAFGNFLLYAMINTGRFPLMVFGYVVTFVILECIGFGALSAVFASAFQVRSRYSGMTVGVRLSGVLGTGIGASVATVLVHVTGTIYSVAGYVCVMLLVSGGCLAVLTRQIAAASRVGPGSLSTAGSSTGSPGRVETT
jgi:MFS transporter, MHS family, shikimate and dehydroshikimate transport protein